MDCIPYINDLKIELDMLEDTLQNCKDKEEYQKVANLIEKKKKLMNKYKENLNRLSKCQIEYRIYEKILSGMSICQAVSKVADENYSSNIKPNTFNGVWNYYKKIKNDIFG